MRALTEFRFPPLMAAVVLVLLVPTIAMAQSPQPMPAVSTPALNARIAVAPECSCRAKGSNFALGAVICLETPAGLASFQCEMDQNVTSWRSVRTPCPTS